MSKPRRLLFVNGIREHIFRGGEKWMLNTALELQKRGHLVLISGRKDSLWIEMCAKNGLPVFPTRMRGDFDPFAWRFFYRLIKTHQIEGVCLSMEKAVRLCGLAAKWAGVKAVVSRKGLMLMKGHALYRLAYQHIVDRILTNSHQLKQEMSKFSWLSEEKITVIHNGVVIPQRTPLIEKKAIRQELGISTTVPLLAAGGRLCPQKGFNFLLEAVARVKQQIPTLELMIMGEGESRQGLENLAEKLDITESVHFLGHRSDVPRLLPAADLFVLSSLYEGMPNIVLEAMAAELPVVATAVNGVPELIEDGVSGILVESKNTPILADAILNIMQDKEQMNIVAKNGRQRVETHFSIARMVDQVENLFCELLVCQEAP